MATKEERESNKKIARAAEDQIVSANGEYVSIDSLRHRLGLDDEQTSTLMKTLSRHANLKGSVIEIVSGRKAVYRSTMETPKVDNLSKIRVDSPRPLTPTQRKNATNVLIKALLMMLTKPSDDLTDLDYEPQLKAWLRHHGETIETTDADTNVSLRRIVAEISARFLARSKP